VCPPFKKFATTLMNEGALQGGLTIEQAAAFMRNGYKAEL